MCRFVFSLCSLLLLFTVGCAHSNPYLPTLPASHGRLSFILAKYVEQQSGSLDEFVPVPPGVLDNSTPLVVEPAQAPGVFADAVQVLRGKASEEQVRQAAEDLWASCESGFSEACVFLREQYKAPQKLPQFWSDDPAVARVRPILAIVVIHCRVGVDGVPRQCTALEGGPHGLTEAVLEYATKVRYHPATLAGHPIEIPFTTAIKTGPTHRLTTEKWLEWARARAARFPQSSTAWADLAILLSIQAPEDPWYADSLHYLHVLRPGFWWAANELAWLHVQGGRYAEAAPLAKRARALAPGNSYVLETSAAVMAATGQCEQALLAQRRAVEKLPAEWPAPEKERFARTLEEYERKCKPADAAPAPEQPRG
ncbi:hypothetical protein F0U60_28635 [Archangium minus]|uniref:Tetratricopeptide repeat protein n=1 Tax=Archangium minus TaxID=83450 RepID=A0ABY9WWX6_9BACT|nr:hypothetical protein F0U60_28635 [Archangium minus]